MTETEREAKARDFVDSILEVNRQHGVDTAPAVIGYAAAVKAAASMFRHLQPTPYLDGCSAGTEKENDR
jgi:hypothetical protein